MDYNFWLEIFYWFCAVFFVAKIWEMFIELKHIRIEREIKQAYEQAKKDLIINVKVEKHGDIYYLFEKTSDNFIAQGRSLEELKEVCDKRFRRNVIVANTDELEAMGLK